MIAPEIVQRVKQAVNRARLIDTAVRLIEVPSRTGEAGPCLDRLAEILIHDGFKVERPLGGYPQSPAVAVRLESGRPGRTLQFNGHLDTVHLPFVPPKVEVGVPEVGVPASAGSDRLKPGLQPFDRITGSGASDMKGGTAAAIEALRVLRETGLLSAGGVLFTAHDLHEAPWGLGEQLDQLIAEGYAGDAVLLPEPLSDRLPVVGRGAATWRATVRRQGPPVHEVMRPPDEPSVIAAGAELVTRISRLGERLRSPSGKTDPLAGCETVFIGQIHSGEIYNQYPQECWLQGTRRWLPGTTRADVEQEFRTLLAYAARDTGTAIDCEVTFIRDAFQLNQDDPLVSVFQAACEAISGAALPVGPKPFVDDGNSFYGLKRLPAITHGPRAGGQHTVNEWVSIDDLMRVAALYALVAAGYCGGVGS